MAFFARAIGRSVARAVIARSASRMASRGLANRFNKTGTQRGEMRNRARSVLRSATAGRYGALSELAEEIGELYEEASQIVEAAFYEAMDTMYGMCGNAGQESVFFNHVMPAFADAMDSTEIGDDWPDVDIGEYMYFMGEIVEAGNAIMAEAFDEAASLKGEADDAEADFESLEEEGISEDEFF
jgi:hypothetical protein